MRLYELQPVPLSFKKSTKRNRHQCGGLACRRQDRQRGRAGIKSDNTAQFSNFSHMPEKFASCRGGSALRSLSYRTWAAYHKPVGLFAGECLLLRIETTGNSNGCFRARLFNAAGIFFAPECVWNGHIFDPQLAAGRLRSPRAMQIFWYSLPDPDPHRALHGRQGDPLCIRDLIPAGDPCSDFE